jgi:hypothetical protein
MGGSFVVLGLETQRPRFRSVKSAPLDSILQTSRTTANANFVSLLLPLVAAFGVQPRTNLAIQATHRPTNSRALTHVKAISRPPN